jgi:hypothetical protein
MDLQNLAVLALVAIALPFSGCLQEGTGTQTTDGPDDEIDSGEPQTVAEAGTAPEDYAVSERVLVVGPGDTKTWTWEVAPANVTSFTVNVRAAGPLGAPQLLVAGQNVVLSGPGGDPRIQGGGQGGVSSTASVSLISFDGGQAEGLAGPWQLTVGADAGLVEYDVTIELVY